MLTRAVLDTMIVKAYVYNGSQDAWASEVVRLAEYPGQVAVSLPFLAVVELAEALRSNRLPWDNWASRIHDVDNLLDKEMPILPHAGDLILVAGEPPGSTRDPKYCRRRYAAIWRHLKDMKSQADMGKEFYFPDELGVSTCATFNADGIGKILEDERVWWRNVVGMVRTFFENASEAEAKANKLSVDKTREFLLGSRAAARYPEHVRLGHDAFLRTASHLLTSASRLDAGYKADSEKNKNDAIDMQLLSSLMLQSVLVTQEDKFKNRLVGGKSQDAKRVLQLSEVISHLDSGTLNTLLDDDNEEE